MQSDNPPPLRLILPISSKPPYRTPFVTDLLLPQCLHRHHQHHQRRQISSRNSLTDASRTPFPPLVVYTLYRTCLDILHPLAPPRTDQLVPVINCQLYRESPPLREILKFRPPINPSTESDSECITTSSVEPPVGLLLD